MSQKRIWSARVLLCFLLLAALLLTLAGASLAWLMDMTRPAPKEEFSASSIAAYFAGGDGKSAETAYRIETSEQLYNLAWLQNLGKFNQPDDPTKVYYFKLAANEAGASLDLDMKGKLAGTDGIVTGAIPPIGTKTYPFQGVFDGNGSVIRNLWISTYHDDWQEHPANMSTYESTHVGLFGAVDKGAVIKNFNVDRLEVTTHYSATVGILCGYVNASVSGVGVYNGFLDFKGSGIQATSAYTLFGETGANVDWSDKPTVNNGTGGEIIVDPNNIHLVEATASMTRLSTIAAGAAQAVTKAIPGTAYYSGKLEVKTRPDKKSPSMWIVDENGDPQQVFDATPFEDEYVWEAFQRYKDDSSSVLIAPMSAPSIAADDLVPISYQKENDDGEIVTENLKIPANAVWFRPECEGTAALAFTKDNNGGNFYMSIYQYKRDKTSKALTQVSETKFLLPQDTGNASVVYHEHYIEKAEENASYWYEYAIGIPSNYNNSKQVIGFFCMMLAGANAESGPEDSDVSYNISDVDYIVNTTTNVGASGYVMHNVLFSLSGTTTEAGKITYLAWSDGKVYYLLSPASFGLTVKDNAYNGVGASSTTNANVVFNKRDDGSPTNTG